MLGAMLDEGYRATNAAVDSIMDQPFPDLERQAMIDEAVRRVYPFACEAGPLKDDCHKVRRVWRGDDCVLMERPWIVTAIRAEFARIAEEAACPHSHSIGCGKNLRCLACGEPLSPYWNPGFMAV